jgi:pimeloyl-ACP methyl ester carboxylesterase
MSPRSSIVSRIAHETLAHSPSTMPAGRWWENLEVNFAQRPEGFELEPRDWLRVQATAVSDIAMRTAGASMLSLIALPASLLPRPDGRFGLLAGESRDEWQVYLDLLETDPRALFAPPAEQIDVTCYAPRTRPFTPVDGVCEGLKFESPYQPYNREYLERYTRHRRSRLARARHWRHNDGPRPTLIAVHGFMADPYWLNERFFALQRFYEQGCDVLLYTLPHHGLRQEPTSLFSGLGFFTNGLGAVNEHMAQAICELRALMDWLAAERGVSRVGITGISLGGWTAALLASVDERLQFAIPNVPVASPFDLILEWQPTGLAIRLGLAATGLSVRDGRRLLALTTPLTHPPAIAKERLMIIGGVGDRLAPPKHSRLLWNHWDRCRIHWFPGNHVLHLDRGEYLTEILRFMRELEFLE